MTSDPQAKDPDLPPGTEVGEYRIETKLGEGGFGVVYRAVHPLIGKTAAVKVLGRQWSANPEMMSRFVSEARAVNQIRHRNIIDIFSFGNLPDGRAYYVMELLDGVTFDAYLDEQGPLPIDRAVPILRQVAKALDAAHAAGIAHRDLKPENIFLVVESDGAVFPKLLDFGIAKLLSESGGGAHKTRTGTPMGTPHYMSPEQCRGKDVDHRTDIYSFGVMTWKTLTGELPFDGDDVLTILVKHTTEAPPPASSKKKDLPKQVDVVLAHMMAKEAADRPQTLNQAMDDLCRAVGIEVPSGPNLPRPSGRIPDTAAEAKTIAGSAFGGETLESATAKKPLPIVPIAIGFVAVVGIAAAAVVLSKSSPPEPQRVTAASTGEPPKPTAAPPAASSAPVVAPVTTTVEITVQGAPATAEVFLGAERLGKGPGPFPVPKSDAKAKLVVRAEGYKPFETEIAPTANVVVPATLTKVVKAAAPKAPGELENPFK